MFVTLLLPIVVPYGNPWTIFNPNAHYLRKVEFCRWIESVDNKHKKYRHVPLMLTQGNEQKNKQTNRLVGDIPHRFAFYKVMINEQVKQEDGDLKKNRYLFFAFIGRLV